MYVNTAMLTVSLFSFISVYSESYASTQVKVSVPWLLELVVSHSDDIARQRNSLSSNDASLLSIDAALDPRVGASISHLEDKNERSSSAPSSSAAQKISINVSKAFSTGTSLSSELSTSANEQEIVVGNPPANQTNEYKESTIKLELRQSLLKNSFGYAYRSSRTAADTAKIAKKHSVEDGIENYLEVVIDQYFTIWAAFSQLSSAEERLKREQRRKKIYDRQYKRGFIEKKDILQIDSSILSAEKSVSDSSQQILSLLIRLGTIVKMDLYQQYREKKINIEFAQESIADVQKLCQKNTPVASSLSSEVYQKRIHSFTDKLSSINSNAKPDVYLAARISANGIDDETSTSLGKASSLTHPQYYIALGIDMIIGNSANTVEKLEAIKSRSENEILLSQEKANLASDWLETCNSLQMISKKRQFITKKLDLDSQRIKLLDQDFRLGKTDLSTLLLAEDSLTNNKSSLASLSAQLYNTAWHLRKQSGNLRKFVNIAMNR
ncbi:MAG: TolC family protein [Oligoflexales bacterium]|nr:TolC family protein [Oligoflexales bacterium]